LTSFPVFQPLQRASHWKNPWVFPTLV
jgi:hypothetical protein